MKDDLALIELADLLSILSNPDRLRILFELRDGPKDVATLVSAVGVSQSRTSQHLGLLKAHHLVRAERQGRKVIYHLCDHALPPWVADGFRFLETGPTHGRSLDDSIAAFRERYTCCLLYTSPSPRDRTRSRMPSSA